MEKSDEKRFKLVTEPIAPGTDSLVPIYKDIITGEVKVLVEGKWRKIIWEENKEESVQIQATESVSEFDRLKNIGEALHAEPLSYTEILKRRATERFINSHTQKR